jgi:hypothetical protein
MFDPQQAKTSFLTLDHKTKLAKVKESLAILGKKSSFFADIRDHFNKQKDIQENALDAMYSMVMNLIFQQNK